LPLYPSHDRSSVRRSLNYLSFFVSAFVYLVLRRPTFDLAYVYHPPITVGLAAALARIPFVLDVQDLWPETIAATGMPGASRLVRPLEACCRFVYARALAVFAQSEGIRRALIDRGVPSAKVSLIRNWAEAEFDGLPHRPRKSRSFTIVYAGNLGRAQQLGNLLEACAILWRERPEIRIALYGSGVDEPELRQAAKARHLDNIEFRGRICASQIGRAFAQADALLLHLSQDPLFDITIPSKTQAYLSAGRPIVAAVNGETAKLLRESGAAVVVPPADPAALARAIVEMADTADSRRAKMGRSGAEYYRRHFSFSEGMARTIAQLEGTYARMAAGQGGR